MRCPECKRDVDPSRDGRDHLFEPLPAGAVQTAAPQAASSDRAAVNAFHRELLGFLTGFEKRFAKWQAANPALDDEGKAALMQALYLTADGLIEELDDR